MPAVNRVPVVSTGGATIAGVRDRIFDWVEHKFPEHAIGGTGTTGNGTTFPRCYAGNLSVRVDAGRLQLVSPGGAVTDFAFHGDFLSAVELKASRPWKSAVAKAARIEIGGARNGHN